MTAPAAVSSAVAALQAQVTALYPLENQTLAALAPVTLAAEALVGTLDAAIPGAAGGLDAPPLNVAPPDMPSALLGLLSAAQGQLALVQQRGLAGRILINVGSLPPYAVEAIPAPAQ